MKKVEILRKKYPRFVFESYSWEILKGNLKISFDFRIENRYEAGSRSIYFNPKIVIKNINKNQIKRVGVEPPRVLNNLVFNLGLIEMLSYWKATCSPEILIEAGSLNKEQIKWWRDLINRGMGQFFYENKIDFTTEDFLNISTTNEAGSRSIDIINEAGSRSGRVLVPIGGGKDSVVTLEILKKTKKNIRCFSLNPTGAAQKIMEIGGCKNPIIVRRKIDPKLLELNRQGFLNGHTPFSAYLAFLSVLCAVLFNYKYIAFSNERSSNEGNVKYLGKIINHQYSKSFDFEKKFRDYSKKYLTKNIEYFSFLRPLYEIQIAKLFSNYQKYFNAFLSCNVAYQTDSGTKKPIKKWCGNCPKCLFIFATLYPFLEKRKLIEIFGQNLFEKRKLLSTMLQLIGHRKFKPFECVGTKKESLIAFYLSWKEYGLQPTHRPPASSKHLERFSARLPFLLRYFEKKILPKYPNLERESNKILNSWNSQHYLPKEFEKMLKEIINL